jgi:hypothetical protein
VIASIEEPATIERILEQLGGDSGPADPVTAPLDPSIAGCGSLSIWR